MIFFKSVMFMTMPVLILGSPTTVTYVNTYEDENMKMENHVNLPQWNSCVHDHGCCCKAHKALYFPHRSVGCSEAYEPQRMSLFLLQTLVASPTLALLYSADFY